jgi:hypothetical protein
MACFSCYSEYFQNFEKAKHIEQSMMKSNRGFREFVEVSFASGLAVHALRD